MRSFVLNMFVPTSSRLLSRLLATILPIIQEQSNAQGTGFSAISPLALPDVCCPALQTSSWYHNASLVEAGKMKCVPMPTPQTQNAK